MAIITAIHTNGLSELISIILNVKAIIIIKAILIRKLFEAIRSVLQLLHLTLFLDNQDSLESHDGHFIVSQLPAQ